MRLEYLLLEETIKDICKSGPVYFLANLGNWGDGLIRAGALKFFNDIGLKYKELQPQKRDWVIPFIRGGTVIYGGGGAWCDLYEHGYEYVKKLHRRFNIIVLPSTYQRHFPLSNTTFFSRDKYESQQNMPDSHFCHDMAFFLKRIETIKGNGTGYFFRTDEDRSGKITLPPENVDISSKGNHFSNLYPLFQELSKYSVIYTDRLHVAIASGLSGKEVHLYQNSYFKIKAIYKSSIVDHFENIHFHEDYEI